MNTPKSLQVFLAAACLVAATQLSAKVDASPKGGRWLETGETKTEFFVNADRRAEIGFYDAALKPRAPGGEVVALTAETKDRLLKVEMERTATGYVSKTPLPEAGEPYRIVVQVRPDAGAKPRNFRIDLNLKPCAECGHAEYACTCEGH